MDKANVRCLQGETQHLKEEAYTPYLAYRDSRFPWYTKVFVALPVGNVFSLIDPMPDLILMVGLLDEMAWVPLGVIAARRMIPDEVLAECRVNSREVMRQGKKPVSRVVAVTVAVWLLLATPSVEFAFRIAQGFGT